ncbi:MAG: hypothetical protein IKZ25_04645 [Clostridia bacterium]|nr:hypothetical protein [Clostridia bacterium]
MNEIFNKFEIKDKKNENIGKIIVWIIATINFIYIALTFFSLFSEDDSASLYSGIMIVVTAVVLNIQFLLGTDWIRVLFAFYYTCISTWQIYGLFEGIYSETWWAIVISIILTAYSISAAIVLFKSRSVKEYLYAKQNG